ncbi:pimeloyl-ACP methyl ester carboxylesterase [Amycolatopsis thermophila]|uniref:Pimeloyl-ACP methyl ester carboxylesterase n=1 Tax=Amycolatopsis thermophila TaxID=206084 RepID=A0ABU0EUY0_9PSEU|nr:pimeloyl-ACP methyl ester carboxylesterase [Amycolatopsis thermophila]
MIVPSLPGFGFSSPLRRADLNFGKIADLWHTLVTEVLGFEKYAVGGCDVGALVAGQLAWILQRWLKWSAAETVYSKDELLTHAMIYWTTNTIGSSIRTYANNVRYSWRPSHDRWPVVEAPTGLTLVGHENPPGVLTPEARVRHFRESDRARWYNRVNVRAHERGGHFIPWEIPGEWVEDLRRTFRIARASRD